MDESRVFRSGFVTMIGKPNVGKSSLVNALAREKVAAVSAKPQTTRSAVRAVMTDDDAQAVFVDTPGIHRPRHRLGEYMMRQAADALDGVDVVCYVTEAGRPLGPEGQSALELAAEAGCKRILIANKIDRVSDPELFWQHLPEIADRLRPDAVVPVSAKEGTNLDVLAGEIKRLLPEGELIYPEDTLTDATERFLAEEIIREKIFDATEQEIPHSVAVVVEEFKSPDEYPDRSDLYIRADIIVERPGQKAILIGSGGRMIQAVGKASRREMAERFGWPVKLDLWVKVRPGWRKTDAGLARAGYRG